MLVIAKVNKTKLFSTKMNELKIFGVQFRCSENVENTEGTARTIRYFLKSDDVSKSYRSP